MNWKGRVLIALLLGGCHSRQADVSRIAEAQRNSLYGPTDQWKLDPAVPRAQIQEIRDRGYAYCLTKKPTDKDCANQQDHSVFMYASAFAMVRMFRSEAKPTFPYAIGHKQGPETFDLVRRYCMSVYDDAGSNDARALGPCMSAGVGADFFGVVPKP